VFCGIARVRIGGDRLECLASAAGEVICQNGIARPNN